VTSKDSKLRLGTRGSALARWQANWVAAQLDSAGVPVEIIHVTTQGDVKTGALGKIGGQGLFTKEIQQALLDDRIDLAVHSLKDLPTETVPGLELAVVPPRESNRDVLVCQIADSLEALADGSRIGTGSIRRRAQLLHARPGLEIGDIRGNVDTRLRHLEEDKFDAIVLAEAGLKRLERHECITEVLPVSLMMPAVGQGALGLETRADDDLTRTRIGPLDDMPTHAAVLAERTLLAALRAGCLAPVGAWGRLVDGQLKLDAVVLSVDGKERLVASASGEIEDAAAIGESVAKDLLGQGAARLIEGSHQ